MILQDNKVELVGTYGGDLEHALAAWTSTGAELTDERRERIPDLLKFLAENKHMTPFERSTLHFNVTCDTASHIHFLKHRTIAANGESARYKELKDDKALMPQDWQQLEYDNVTISRLNDKYEEHLERSYELYHEAVDELETVLLDRKRAKESARFFLPYGNQLTLDISMSFRAFVHFLGLRMDDEAQLEIRNIADSMLQLVLKQGDFEHSLTAFGY